MSGDDTSDSDIRELLLSDMAPPPGDFARHLRNRTANEVRDVTDRRTRVAGLTAASRAVRRTAALATVLLLVLAFAVTTKVEFGDPLVGVVFADVQEAMGRQKTVEFRQTLRNQGKIILAMRVFIVDPHLIRAEISDGSHTILNLRTKKWLRAVPSGGGEHVSYGMVGEEAPPPEFSFYTYFQRIAASEARKSTQREIEGRVMDGFLVQLGEPESNVEAQVWVDPRTKLPVRIEVVSESGRTTIDDIVFGKEFDRSMFAFTTPESFDTSKVDGIGVGSRASESNPAAPNEVHEELTLTPLVGLGDVAFGTAREQILTAFGTPDETMKIAPGVERLYYYTRGLGLLVYDDERGLREVIALGRDDSIQAFRGKTDKGICLGASQTEIERAYGKPDRMKTPTHRDVYGARAAKPDELTGQTSLTYDSLGLIFSLVHDRLHQIRIRDLRR